ncbi:hypothetical protein [Actinoplanes sp. NBRC 103695]|uniref:glycine-rich domain-containing protein n=1 Tax=Actinoplanes sp. NBRC 103695 TaxID=3032202 RepID=UPI0024A5E154|nr:hypothetical protein [Actinoplanes sp. NBRC 103695]GLY96543.1 hypothetical protein Acsp02_37980 [Actinoplanes sp. NBRC 103695]
MTDTLAVPTAVKTGRSLIHTDLFDRLTARISTEHPELGADMPARIVDQALVFLGACAVATRPIGPSELVDIGWHTFVLYTVEYRQFCDEIAGRFIEHVPDDDRPAKPVPPSMPVTLADTVAAIRTAGYRVDPQLWHGDGADCNSKCNQCHAGCHDSPRG